MANPTSNFGWQMPTNTDLVKDLPADFETFGQAVDTSMADLKGGTTGQILSKNSNTDMDFVWIANDQGDITGITATSPLTGGGTSGAITVGIQSGSTTQSGAVQLTDSTSSTSTTTAATPNSVKSAYDLADGAIPKSLIDAAGDLIVGTADNTAGRLAIGSNGYVLKSNGTTASWAIDPTNDLVTTAGDILYATAADTLTRLGIGTAGQVLTVNTGATAPEWKTASSGGMTLLSTTTLSGTSTTISSISQDYVDLYIIISGVNISANDYPRIDINGSSGAVYVAGQYNATNTDSTELYFNGASDMKSGNANNVTVLNIYNYASTAYYKAINKITQYYNFSTTVYSRVDGGAYLSNTAVTSIKVLNLSGATFNAGQVKIYGVK